MPLSKADQEVIAAGGGMENLATMLSNLSTRQTRSATKNQGGPSQQQETNSTPSGGGNKSSDKPSQATANSKGKAVAIRATASQDPGEAESPRTRPTSPEHEDPEGDNQSEGGDQPEKEVQTGQEAHEQGLQSEHEVQQEEVQQEEVQQEEVQQEEVQQEEEGRPDGEDPLDGGEPPAEVNSHLAEVQRLEGLLELARQKQFAESPTARTEVVHDTTGAASHQNKGAGPGRENADKRKQNENVGKAITKPTDGAIKKQTPAKRAPAKQKSMAQTLIAKGFEDKAQAQAKAQAQVQEDLDMAKKKEALRHFVLHDMTFLQLLIQDGDLRDALVQAIHQIDPEIISVPVDDISMASEPSSRPRSNTTMASAPDIGLQASGETPSVGASEPPRGPPGNQQQGNPQFRLEPLQQPAGLQQQGAPRLRASEPPQRPPYLQQQSNPRASEPPRQVPSRQQFGPPRITKVQVRLRTVWFRDPETLEWGEAEIYGRMRQKGRMAIQLPSLNPDYPDCLRRYNVWCKDYDVKWNTLKPLAGEADYMRLKEMREQQDCYGRFDPHRPDVTGIITSLAGTLLRNLQLALPPGKEWHSITDSQRAFGDYSEQIEVYMYCSGAATPKLPLPVHQREYLERLALQQDGVEAALENLDREREQELAKIKEMGLKLRHKHVNDFLAVELQARQGWGQGSGEPEVRSKEVPPGPVGGHQDVEEDEIT